MNTKAMWNSFLEKIKGELSSVAFDTWFAETELYEISDNIAKVIVPMHIHKKCLKENYNDLIEEIFTEISGTNFKLEYFTKEEIESNIEINTDNIGVPAVNFESNLKPHYTFENFIEGESNTFARKSAFAVAEYPGSMYNPLFIYGNSGLGKTHLMHAIGNHIVKNSKKRVLYAGIPDAKPLPGADPRADHHAGVGLRIGCGIQQRGRIHLLSAKEDAVRRDRRADPGGARRRVQTGGAF